MKQQLVETIRSLYGHDVTVTLTRPDPVFGDWATNAALQLARPLGRNPRDIAKEIAQALQAHEDVIEASVAGPGFVNIRLRDAALIRAIYTRPAQQYTGQRIVFEYSCPNAFKELHTGHLYQTIYGDIVSRMLLAGGADLQRTSFGGDVGLHVAKCLWGMVHILGGEYPQKLTGISSDVFERARWISQCYVTGAAAYEESAAAATSIDKLNKTIYGFHDTDNHETPLAQLYWTTRQWSFDYFDAFYRLIDVVPMHYYPESQTAPTGMDIVRAQLAKGNLEISDGAVIFRGDESRHLHTRVFVTRHGLPTYETKDIGVIWREKEDYQFDHRYLLTGNDQKEYMRVVFAAAETFRPELAGTMTHFTNGTVRFADGKKMSSRLGNVSRAADVIDVVRERVADIVQDASLIEVVTLGAVKYAFAKYKLGGDINFDLDETVSLHGNSGPYLQYAHARARRVLEKAPPFARPTRLFEEDRPLVRKLGEYHEVVDAALVHLEPHYICTYLFELAQEFNRYYEQHRVIGSDKEAHRSAIIALYADTLRAGLTILGITAPDHL